MTENIQEKIEDKIIDCINLTAGGRLVIFKPEKKGFEDYLAVGKKGNYKEKEIYFEIISLAGQVRLKGHPSNFVKDFIKDDFQPSQNFYLLFVFFNEITQKISDNIWLVPSLYFRDAAEVVKSQEGENILRFQAPTDIKNKNEYSKFIVDAKELGKLILDALERGGEFEFKEAEYGRQGAVNLDSLKEFLCEARRSTYAAGAPSIDNPRLLASKQLEFQKRDYFYRDIYFTGDKKIIGQEIVYQNSNPVWGMSYIGDAIGKLKTNFLKESLLRLSERCRFGEVCKYKKRELEYQDNGHGSLEEFFGKEKIFLEGKNIYKLDYQGGLL